MVMEALEGYEAKIQYDIVGHSGEAKSIKFVDKSNPPKNNKQLLEAIRVSSSVGYAKTVLDISIHTYKSR